MSSEYQSALDRARGLWGALATVYRSYDGVCFVGTIISIGYSDSLGYFDASAQVGIDVRGEGDSWDAAFAAAEAFDLIQAGAV